MTETASGVSVVVICRNEAAYIDDCLGSLAAAATRCTAPVEIIVVDGDSGDGTAALAERWDAGASGGPVVRVVRCPWYGYSRQRNAGVAAATQPWVAFVSADVRVEDSWLREAVEVLDETVDAVIGRFELATPEGGRGWMAALTPTLYPSCTEAPEVERCSTVHLFVRRELLRATPFDERLTACEDKDLAHRLGLGAATPGRVGYLSSRPRHLAREGFGQFLRKVNRESRAMGRLAQLHDGTFPDCFGWGATARRSAVLLGVSLGVATAAVLRTGSGRAAVPPLAAWLVAGNWHPAGWRRRPVRGAAGIGTVVLHVVSMTAVSAGYLTGWLQGTRLDRA